jgi:hypothetical protein
MFNLKSKTNDDLRRRISMLEAEVDELKRELSPIMLPVKGGEHVQVEARHKTVLQAVAKKLNLEYITGHTGYVAPKRGRR